MSTSQVMNRSGSLVVSAIEAACQFAKALRTAVTNHRFKNDRPLGPLPWRSAVGMRPGHLPMSIAGNAWMVAPPANEWPGTQGGSLAVHGIPPE